jgi:hypothetical protein
MRFPQLVWLLALLIATGCRAPHPDLVAHSGPNKVYSLRVPKGAQFKKESRSDDIPQGKVKVNGEIWEMNDEGGVAGVADIPLIRAAAPSTYTVGNGYMSSSHSNQGLGRALSDDEILEAVCEGQVKAVSGEMGAKRPVKKLGYRGLEVDLSIPSKKLQGRILYLWGNRRLYFCLYASEQNSWDETRAQAVLNSFHFSTVR